MTEREFLHKLGHLIDELEKKDIKGELINETVIEIEELCMEYLDSYYRTPAKTQKKSLINGSD